MPKVSVDFSQVEEFEALEKGEYSAEIDKITMRETDDPEKYNYLNVEYNITEPGSENRKVWQVLSFSPKSLFRMKQFFEALGLALEDIEIEYDEDTMEVTDPDVAGSPVLLRIKQRTYEGRLQNEVESISSADSGKKGAKKTTTGRAPAKKSPAKKFK